MKLYLVRGVLHYEPGPGAEPLLAFVDEETAEGCRKRFTEGAAWDREDELELPNGRDASFYDAFEVTSVPLSGGGVFLDESEAAEIADHLADYDITARLSKKEDGRPIDAVMWSRELRSRIREDDPEGDEQDADE